VPLGEKKKKRKFIIKKMFKEYDHMLHEKKSKRILEKEKKIKH
jgi:hypothetical protein